MTEKWRNLERKIEKRREKVGAFYETKLMQLVEQAFIEETEASL